MSQLIAEGAQKHKNSTGERRAAEIPCEDEQADAQTTAAVGQELLNASKSLPEAFFRGESLSVLGASHQPGGE